jgi:hypothetical protein
VDNCFGQYKVSLSGLKRGVKADRWLLLQENQGNAEIRLQLTAVDFGDPPTQEEIDEALAIEKEHDVPKVQRDVDHGSCCVLM